MGVEVTDICMDKEPDSVVTYSIPVSHDSNNMSTNLQDVLPPCERGDEDLKCYAREENAEVSECEVKECTTEKPIEISTLCQVENGKDQDFSSNKCEIGASVEEQKSESRKAKDDCKKPRASMKPMVKSASGNCKTKCTVPQPFALATAKRASFGTRPLGTESDNVTTNKTLNTSTTPSSGTKQNQVAAFTNLMFYFLLLLAFSPRDQSQDILLNFLIWRRREFVMVFMPLHRMLVDIS